MSSLFVLLLLIITCCYLPGVDLVKASDKKLTKDYKEKTDEQCILEPDRGPCKRLLKRWFWNSTAHRCKVFTYGGCEGNLNRFDTKNECITLCQAKYSTSDDAEKEKEKPLIAKTKVHLLTEQEQKHLDAKKRRLAKERTQKGRETDMKNRHRKKKKKEKGKTSQSEEDNKPKTIKSKTALEVPAICLLKPDQGGGCNTQDLGKYWYYFDATTSKCFKFWYWGCGGNLNRFETNHKCLKKCVRSTEIRLKNHKRHCDKCDYKTSTCHKVSRGNFTCNCIQGFKKNASGACVDEDECLSFKAECSPYAWCDNSVGSYSCVCMDGYRGTGKLCERIPFNNQVIPLPRQLVTDVNECMDALPVCPDHSLCHNTIGSYYCECDFGYGGSGKRCSNNPTICAQPFDERYKRQCGSGLWSVRYFYNETTATCERFWYDQCQLESLNIFTEPHTCQVLCARKMRRARDETSSSSTSTTTAVACSDEFDVRNMEQCQKASWIARYYFDRRARRCQMFWYDASCDDQPKNRRTNSRNYFAQLITCQWMCEAKLDQMPQMHPPQQSANQDRRHSVTSTATTMGKISASFSQNTQETRPVITDHSDQTQSSSRSSSSRREEPLPTHHSLASHHRVGSYPGIGQISASFSSKNTQQSKGNSVLPHIGVISASFSSTKDANKPGSPPQPSSSPRIGKITASLSSTSAATQPRSNAISFGKISAFIEQSPNLYEAKEKVVDIFDPVGIIKATKTEQMASSRSSLKRRSEASVNRIPGTEAVVDNQIFSMRYKAMVTVAANCLEPFDDILSKSCGTGQWQSRYHFDADQRRCRMFWFDNCKSHSRNNFGDLESCQWMCEGTHPKPEAKACLDAFDETYKNDCRNGKFESRFFFDHDTKQCQLFWFGGCQSRSKNLFADIGVCQNLCETPNRDLSRLSGSCLDPFDATYEQSCSNSFQQKYYFDIQSKSCKMFWYGHCKGASENIYPSLATCHWLCERPKSLEPPKHCIDKFDEKYSQSCAGGDWEEKWFFSHKTGECESFWYDQCKSTSENIFPDRKTCQWLCELPSPPYIPPSHLPETCLEDVQPGTCSHNYPAYHYNRHTARCEPFSYTGCGGNRNRFLTVQQCEQTCEMFTNVNGHDADCLLPLDVGHGREDSQCHRNAGYRYYYNREYGKCGRFWYFGCGGNENRFTSDAVCRVACGQNHHLLESSKYNDPSVCFLAEDKGSCLYIKDKPVQRWSYSPATLECHEFTYNGCGGNRNRFGSQKACEMQCKGLKQPNSDLCAYWPDWGPCNQLRWMWFYNMTRGSCEQFLWGGCEGNTNRYSSYESCQRTCEVSVSDPCLERLDRGKWCESMSNRYFYDQKTKKCKGFHYTGCGQSANNFLTLSECQSQCIFKTVVEVKSSKESSKTKYTGIKPPVKNDMKRHVFLSGDTQSYLKTEAQWVDYGQCMGFRYNISGLFTKLTSYLCLMEENGHCMTEIYTDTKGEENCKVVRPWLRGNHLYSWFFTVDKRPRHWNDYPVADYQYRNETIVSLLLLGLNNCWNVC